MIFDRSEPSLFDADRRARLKSCKQLFVSKVMSSTRFSVRVRTFGCLSALLLSSCIVTNEPPSPRNAACQPAVTCPAGSQCMAINLAPAASAAPAPDQVARPKPHAFELSGSEVRAIHSDLTGKDYELLIDLPPSFEKEPGRRYPVLFLLDGQWDFALLKTLSGGLRYDKVMPEMLIVGLSYGLNARERLMWAVPGGTRRVKR